MSDELIEKQLRDTFRKKLYFKKYYIENTEDYKEKYITEESIAKKKAYYELHKEKRKQYQKDRYNAKIKNMNKTIKPEDIIINKLFKEYLEEKIKLEENKIGEIKTIE